MTACSSCNFVAPVQVRFCPLCGAKGLLMAQAPEESSAVAIHSEAVSSLSPPSEQSGSKAPAAKARRTDGGKRRSSNPPAEQVPANGAEPASSTNPIGPSPIEFRKRAKAPEPDPKEPDPSPVISDVPLGQSSSAAETKRTGSFKTIGIAAVLLVAIVGGYMISRPRLDQAQQPSSPSLAQPPAEPRAPTDAGGNCSERDQSAGLCKRASR
jgi:hypothetical protein